MDRGTEVTVESSSRQRVIAGGLWVGAGFVGQQGMAVLRTLVLARLLTPDDFGLVGVVTLAIFAALMLSEFGMENAIVQRGDLPPRYVQTAWTLHILRGVLLFVLLQAAAPWIAEAFGRPDAEGLLRVGAVSLLLLSWPAVPAALLAREMRFRERAVFDATREAAGTVAAIGLALWRGDAWALMAGLLVGQAVSAVQILFLHKVRPRWTLDREAIAYYWSFGRYLYVSGLLGYIVTKGDDITVGKLRGVAQLGQYQVVFGIAEMLTRGLGDMVSKVVFPAFSRITSEGRSIGDAFDQVWRVHILLLTPIVFLLLLYPTGFVALLLGSQWLAAAPAFAVLVLAETLRALAAVCGILILAGGRTAYLARIKLIETGLFLLLIVPMTVRWGMAGAAMCLVTVYGVSLAAHLYGAQRIERSLGLTVVRSWEPVFVGAALSGLAWGMTVRMQSSAVILMLLWLALWAWYLWLRQRELLIMLWQTVRAIMRPASPPEIDSCA